MNDEEILRMAQEHPVAEAEKEASRKARNKALIVGLLCLSTMYFAEYFIAKKIDFGKPALMCLIEAISDILGWKNNCNKKELIEGIVYSAAALFFLLLYVGGLFK